MNAARRQFATTIVICAVAAGLVLLAASRDWASTSVEAPRRTGDQRTGADLYPWLQALGFVGLAGAGALVATRGLARLLIGVLLNAVGVGVVAAGVLAIVDGAPVGWPLIAAAGGAGICAAGVRTVRRGRSWPSMGTRYERHTGDRDPDMWGAIDRGEDPTR